MHDQFEIRDTPVGKGVFATQPFLKNQLVGTITGQLFTDPNYGSPYCFDLENGAVVEPAAPFRYVNHSCEPNCEIELYDEDEPVCSGDDRSVILVACRNIEAGEEVTIEYNWGAAHAIRCYCGAASCRGWVVAPEEIDEIVSPTETMP